MSALNLGHFVLKGQEVSGLVAEDVRERTEADRPRTGNQDPQELPVGLAEAVPALGMAEDHVFAAEVLQHRGRDRAGEQIGRAHV